MKHVKGSANWKPIDTLKTDKPVILRCKWLDANGCTYQSVYIGTYNPDYKRWYDGDNFLTNPTGWLELPSVD